MLGVALIFALSASAAAAPPHCYPYEPKTVSLTGTLVRETFPGPPGYTSVKEGDEPETYFLLKFSSPICTRVPAGNKFDSPEKAVAIMQLVFMDNAADFYKDLRPYLGKRVRCTGKLFSVQTGHHHTPVLLQVKDCSPVSKESLQPTAQLLRSRPAAELGR